MTSPHGRKVLFSFVAVFAPVQFADREVALRSDENIREVIATAAETFGKIDFLLHSIAFADREDLGRATVETSREGFKLAMDISAYSLLAVANAAKDMMSDRSSIAAMTYFGGEKCVPGYNVMGICKAALEAAMRYLAYDLGPAGVRVNALSAGPLKTLAGSATSNSLRAWHIG